MDPNQKNSFKYMTDNEIVQLMQQTGSQNTGLRHLMLKYQERLYWVIRNIVESHDDTDDVLQNTFIKAYRNIHRFESRSSLFTWIYRIATNEALTYKKSAARKKTQPLPSTESAFTNHSSESSNSEEEVIERLKSALSTLPDRQRQVFELRYYDEMSYEQIAKLLDLSEGALKASYHHAVKKIELHLVHTSTH
ncbi:MAG: RNA polymerase sigma factor [Saprospiraceae bacterium]|nr:RNA polymerase sigma factor [Saprospiraceae bacterium]MBP9746157.1 RNA polymerase sigma factor [Saprospiraceae bacterium]